VAPYDTVASFRPHWHKNHQDLAMAARLVGAHTARPRQPPKAGPAMEGTSTRSQGGDSAPQGPIRVAHGQQQGLGRRDGASVWGSVPACQAERRYRVLPEAWRQFGESQSAQEWILGERDPETGFGEHKK
jgi:hypothetical protein